MADEENRFAPYLASNYLNTNGGVMLAQVSTGGESPERQGQPDAPSRPDPNTGLGEAYDRIIGKMPRPTVPPDMPKTPPPTAPGKSFLEDLTSKTADKIFDGLSSAGLAKILGADVPKAGWIGIGTTALGTLKDHWSEVPGMVEGIPFPKSFPSNCDGITCDRQD